MGSQIIDLDDDPEIILMVKHQGEQVPLGRAQVLELLDVRAAVLRQQLHLSGPLSAAEMPTPPAKETTRDLQRITLVVREVFASQVEHGLIDEKVAAKLIHMLDEYRGQTPKRPQSQLGYMLEAVLKLKSDHKRLHGRIREFLAANKWLIDDDVIPRRFDANNLIVDKSPQSKKGRKTT